MLNSSLYLNGTYDEVVCNVDQSSTGVCSNINGKNRTINIFDEFNKEICNSIIEKLLEWEEEDSKILQNHSKLLKQVEDKSTLLKPITININSPGGNVDDLFAIIDMLNSMTAKVITRAIGKACSCGFILFTLGDERIVGNNSSLMYHDVSYGYRGQYNDHDNYMKHVRKIRCRIDDIICKKTKLTKKKINEWKKNPDTWFDAVDAINVGIATSRLY